MSTGVRDTGFAASNAGKTSIIGYLQPKFDHKDFPDGFFGVLSENSINS